MIGIRSHPVYALDGPAVAAGRKYQQALSVVFVTMWLVLSA